MFPSGVQLCSMSVVASDIRRTHSERLALAVSSSNLMHERFRRATTGP
jgi:hypothetical protein